MVPGAHELRDGRFLLVGRIDRRHGRARRVQYREVRFGLCASWRVSFARRALRGEVEPSSYAHPS